MVDPGQVAILKGHKVVALHILRHVVARVVVPSVLEAIMCDWKGYIVLIVHLKSCTSNNTSMFCFFVTGSISQPTTTPRNFSFLYLTG